MRIDNKSLLPWGLLILSLYISDWLSKFASGLGEFSQMIAVFGINCITLGTALSCLYCAWRSLRQFMRETKELDRESPDKNTPNKTTKTEVDKNSSTSDIGVEQ